MGKFQQQFNKNWWHSSISNQPRPPAFGQKAEGKTTFHFTSSNPFG
jgi:hypothetical protein